MAKLAVFAGHGGSDPGAVCGGRKESDYTLSIALAVKKRLEAAGHTVVINRTDNRDSTIDAKVKLADSQKVDAVIEIHLNAGGGQGSEVYYSMFGKGRSLAENILSGLTGFGFKNRGIKTRKNSAGTADYFGIIRGPAAQSVLVETCFIDSNSDMNLFKLDGVSASISGGILKSFPAVKPAPPKPTNNKGEFEKMKRYENGSTRENVYEDTDLKKKIGSLDPYEKCDCACIVNNKPLVIYTVGGTSRKKSGFVKWIDGVK